MNSKSKRRYVKKVKSTKRPSVKKVKSTKRRSVKKVKSTKRRSTKVKRINYKRLSNKKRSCVKNKVAFVMKEFKNKSLKSSSGYKVTNPKQGIAIALSIARKKCL